MFLDEFIKETLTSIINGILTTQEEVREKGIEIAPPILYDNQVLNNEHIPIYNVDFKVELTESINEKGRKGVGVGFGKFEVGVSKEKGGDNTSLTRVEFTIPITYPCRYNVKGWLSDQS